MIEAMQKFCTISRSDNSPVAKWNPCSHQSFMPVKAGLVLELRQSSVYWDRSRHEYPLSIAGRLSSLVLHFGSYWLKVFSWTLPNHTTPDGPNPWDQDFAMFVSCFAVTFGMGHLWSFQLASAPSRHPWGLGKGERLAWKGWCNQLEFAWIFSPLTKVGCEDGAIDSFQNARWPGLLKAILSFLIENLSSVFIISTRL